MPIANLIGFHVEEIGDGRAVRSLQTGPQHSPITAVVDLHERLRDVA